MGCLLRVADCLRRLFGEVIATGARQIALTFDDGPHSESTPAVLNVLAGHDVPATFFVIGSHAQKHVSLLQQIHAQGHLIANHSFDHTYLGTLNSCRYWINQIAHTNAVIEKAIGQCPALFRPPMGFKNIRMAKAARQQQCTIVTWSRRAWDGLPTTADRIVRRLNHGCQAGDIILMHDGVQPNGCRNHMATAEALGPLIGSIRSAGFELVRLDVLLNLKPYRQQAE